jgi:hypothetical protein
MSSERGATWASVTALPGRGRTAGHARGSAWRQSSRTQRGRLQLAGGRCGSAPVADDRAKRGDGLRERSPRADRDAPLPSAVPPREGDEVAELTRSPRAGEQQAAGQAAPAPRAGVERVCSRGREPRGDGPAHGRGERERSRRAAGRPGGGDDCAERVGPVAQNDVAERECRPGADDEEGVP